MRNFTYSLIIFVILLCGKTSLVRADHGHGSSVSSSASQSYSKLFLQDAVAKPTTQFFLVTELTQLDESLGQIYTSIFGGEYAILKKLSVGGFLPVSHIAHNFRSSSSGLGDLSVYFKYLFYESSRFYTYLSSEWGFPTGKESDGLGNGNVFQTVSFLLSYDIKSWKLYFSGGSQFSYESHPDPQIISVAGISTPRFIKNRVSANLSLLNTVITRSDVFSNGSGKLFVQPQINIFLDRSERWVLTASSKVSVFDYFSRKEGVTLSNIDSALLIDVLVSGSLGLNFNFK